MQTHSTWSNQHKTSAENHASPDSLDKFYQGIMATYPVGSYIVPNAACRMLPLRIIGDIELKDETRADYICLRETVQLYLEAKQIKYRITNPATDSDSFSQLPNLASPVLIHDNKHLWGTVAVMRYLTKRLGEYGSNVLEDFINDAVVDKLSEWRRDIDEVISEFEEAESEEALLAYQLYYNNRRRNYFSEAESMIQTLAKSDCTFLTGNTPGMANIFLFGIIQDDATLVKKFASEERSEQNTDEVFEDESFALLNECPKLNKMYNAIVTHPRVKKYLQNKNANVPDIERPCDTEVTTEERVPTKMVYEEPMYTSLSQELNTVPSVVTKQIPDGYSYSNSVTGYSDKKQQMPLSRQASLNPPINNPPVSYRHQVPTLRNGARLVAGSNIYGTMMVGENQKPVVMPGAQGSLSYEPVMPTNGSYNLPRMVPPYMMPGMMPVPAYQPFSRWNDPMMFPPGSFVMPPTTSAEQSGFKNMGSFQYANFRPEYKSTGEKTVATNVRNMYRAPFGTTVSNQG